MKDDGRRTTDEGRRTKDDGRRLHAFWGVGITIGPIIMTLGLTAINTRRFGIVFNFTKH